eukprot:scaffold34981_cov19-Prasinocladus_malaysianus.AAC.1
MGDVHSYYEMSTFELPSSHCWHSRCRNAPSDLTNSADAVQPVGEHIERLTPLAELASQQTDRLAQATLQAQGAPIKHSNENLNFNKAEP